MAVAAGPQRPPKRTLDHGVTSATFDLEAETAEDLGRMVDEFIDDLDLGQCEISGSFAVSFEVLNFRAAQHAQPIRTYIGPYRTELTVHRRD